ncbi:hypothetical protein D9V37_01720 [Nocardioides mangrovicus]|uniref:Lipoprotein n=2 Tax=Nocardioides mangrovicus TaxID=2478913 RepID=A0A3L8P661_9ACTN|nr:hypothetical protein D9V37_01720 [Nocardioides mangrovicus]
MRGAKLVAAAAALLALAGCGHAPGSAFSVGDHAVSRSSVDQIVNAACGVQQQTKSARATQVWAFVNAMLTATVQNDYGDHVGASYSRSTLQSELSQYQGSVDALPAKDRAAVTSFLREQIRGSLIVQSVGTQVLADKGVSKPTTAEVTNAGDAAAQKWARQQGITIDPRYNAKDYEAGAGDSSISTPVSSYAKAAQKGSTKSSYLSQLPSTQLCG